ncbi:hypothetical protein Ancab_002213 [Ancistrocladus abbreviatus]
MCTYISTREEGRKRSGKDGKWARSHRATDGPDPTRTPRPRVLWRRVAPGWGDPEESALVGPLIIIPRPPERLFARAAETGRRVKNDVKGRRSGCDHTSTNASNPIRTPLLSVVWARVVLGWVTVPSRRGGFTLYFAPKCPLFAPNFTCYLRGENVHLHLNPRGGSETKRGRMGNGRDHTGTDGPGSHQNPAAKGCLAESSTGMGDPEESALVGPLIIIPRPPERHFARAAEAGRRVKNDVKGRRSGCDHTSTNAPDPIRTPQLSVFGRE